MNGEESVVVLRSGGGVVKNVTYLLSRSRSRSRSRSLSRSRSILLSAGVGSGLGAGMETAAGGVCCRGLVCGKKLRTRAGDRDCGRRRTG